MGLPRQTGHDRDCDGWTNARLTKTHLLADLDGQFLQLRAHFDALAVTTQEETTQVPASGVAPELDPRPAWPEG